MNRLFIFGFVLIFTTIVLGKTQEHRHHEAHVHGAATLGIAFDDRNGQVEFKAAASGVFGFEHQVKSDKDKKKLVEIIKIFETSIGSMIQFDESVECVFSKEKIELLPESQVHDKITKSHHGEHSDFVANFKVKCKKDIKGTKVTFDFSQFKGLHDLDVTLLVGDIQKSIEVKQKPMTLELK